MKSYSNRVRAEQKHRLYQMVEHKQPGAAPWLHLALFFLVLIGLDLGFRWICRFAQTVGLANTLKLMPFTLGWALLLTGVAALLPGLIRRIYMLLVGAVTALLAVTHGIFINMFRKFFSFSDIAFAGGRRRLFGYLLSGDPQDPAGLDRSVLSAGGSGCAVGSAGGAAPAQGRCRRHRGTGRDSGNALCHSG